MKRYWKIIGLVLLIFGTFGSLYIHKALAQVALPEFELVTISGDETILEEMIVYGDFTQESSWESFRLTSDEITYFRDLNFLEQHRGFFQPWTIEWLIEEERNFMRGKSDFPDVFAEDDGKIAYVSPYMSNGLDEFRVEILNRETRDKQKFALDFSSDEELREIHVLNVQLYGNAMYLITINHYPDEKEFHVYEISLEEEKIVNDDTVVEIEHDHHINLFNLTTDISFQEYIIVGIEYVEYDEATYYYHVVDEEIYSYHLPTGEIQPIDIPEGFTTYPDDPFDEEQLDVGFIAVGKEHVHFVEYTSDGLRYVSYDLGKNKQEGEKEVILGEAEVAGLSGMYPAGDRIYLYTKTEDDSNRIRKMMVVDLADGDLVSEVEIKLSEAPKETMVYDVDIFSIQEK